MHPNKVSILGVGLLGGSIGLALKSALTSCQIIGYGHRESTLQTAQKVGAIDYATTNPQQAVEDSDLVILCTPVGLFRDLLTQIAPALKRDALVTDVGSTKRSIVQAAASLLPPHATFVGSHPMAGSEKRGVEFARTDLFKNALCILTPTPQTPPTALVAITSFWQLLGMRTTTLSPDDHDRLLADVSHLPHLTAAALVALQDPTALDLAGKGFLDTTRIASGDGSLWRDILIDNQDHVRASIERLKQQLDQVLHLMTTNPSALRDWLDTQSARRDALLHRKLKELNPD